MLILAKEYLDEHGLDSLMIQMGNIFRGMEVSFAGAGRVVASYFLSTQASYQDRRRFIRQVAVSGVSGGAIGEFRLILPPKSEQLAICRKIHSIDTATAAEETTLAKFRLLKQGLMEDLLTGRVRVTHLLDEES